MAACITSSAPSRPAHLFHRLCSLPVGQVHVHSGGARNRTPGPRRSGKRSSAGSSRGCSGCVASCRTFIRRTQRRAPSHRKSGRLNVDVSVTAVASANQASRRFGDARVVLEDIPRLDSGDSVPGMPSRLGRTTLFTDDFWNVRHICTAADSNGRVSVAPRADLPDTGSAVTVAAVALAVDIGSRPVQCRAAVAAPDSTPRL